MRSYRLVLLAMLAALPFAVSPRLRWVLGLALAPRLLKGPGPYDTQARRLRLRSTGMAIGAITLLSPMPARPTGITDELLCRRHVYRRRPLVPLGLGRTRRDRIRQPGGYGSAGAAMLWRTRRDTDTATRRICRTGAPYAGGVGRRRLTGGTARGFKWWRWPGYGGRGYSGGVLSRWGATAAVSEVYRGGAREVYLWSSVSDGVGCLISLS